MSDLSTSRSPVGVVSTFWSTPLTGVFLFASRSATPLPRSSVMHAPSSRSTRPFALESPDRRQVLRNEDSKLRRKPLLDQLQHLKPPAKHHEKQHDKTETQEPRELGNRLTL